MVTTLCGGCEEVHNRGQRREDLFLNIYLILFNDGLLSLEIIQRWNLTKANWDKFQHLCSTHLHQSAIADADDFMYLFTSILKDIA